ncbi:DEAD/DEAH box helicase [Thermobifida halotolerans]|uniref:DNA 3'-5' helicase n=1 Tax=Thermobifida halotolerans TaxID=483545 RepID=A0A399FZ27_9ACTN|nr:protein DpdF [Thermobifida halotolerans]UOE21079.1 DEAD/DEAH box helicase [Thermobifida halotolerans]
MTSDQWTQAQQLFSTWTEGHIIDIPAAGTVRRLRDALNGLRSGATGWRDIAALTRQVLLEAQVRGNDSPLNVPRHPLFPTQEQWLQAHCGVTYGTDEHTLRVWGQPWVPGSLEGSAAEAAESDLRQVYLGLDSPQRRSLTERPGDPFWSATLGEEFQHYLSAGQQQTARSVALAPPGSTTIVCLPTGHGKTFVALAAALLDDRSGVSVIVVPTVVLAIDLERRIRVLAEKRGCPSPTGRYAYTGDLPAEVKERLTSDIRSGRQRVVLAAPEAVTHGLKRPLADAARAGLFRYFVLDEAHLVDQWGNDFRPDFQSIAGLRHSWVSNAPEGRAPRTVAMSATLTDQQITTLRTLFGSPGPVEVIWAKQVRSEPSYYIDQFTNEEERTAAVLKAATLLPRPLVLYVSKRKAAEDWVARLHNAGMHRVARVTGTSSGEQRRDALQGWSGRFSEQDMPTRFDIVVGTSAFGLGVDLPDVRTVVHSCLPETVDRYYQEVGRGGRDGSPSLAYMATAPADIATAESLSQGSIISDEKAWPRWQGMFHSRTEDGAVFHLNLDALPIHLSSGYGRSKRWNIHTLNLMAQAGLIELRESTEPQRGQDEPEASWQRRLQEYYEQSDSRMDVVLVDGRTNEHDYFTARINETRARILDSQRAALEQLHKALRGDRCIGDVFAEYYTVDDHITAPACRGCPHCRRGGPTSDLGFYQKGWEPNPSVVLWSKSHADPLSAFRPPDQACLSIWWDTEEERELLPELLVQLCRRGMPFLGGPGADEATVRRVQRDALPYPVVYDSDQSLVFTHPAPVIWVEDTDHETLTFEAAARFHSPDVLYLLHPRQLRHPERPDQLLADLHTASIPLRTAWKAL